MSHLPFDIWQLIASDSLQVASLLVRVSVDFNKLISDIFNRIINQPTDQDLLFVGIKKYLRYNIRFLQIIECGGSDDIIRYYIFDNGSLVQIDNPINHQYYIAILETYYGRTSILFVSHPSIWDDPQLDMRLFKIIPSGLRYQDHYLITDKKCNVNIRQNLSRLDETPTRVIHAMDNREALRDFIYYYQN